MELYIVSSFALSEISDDDCTGLAVFCVCLHRSGCASAITINLTSVIFVSVPSRYRPVRIC